MSGEICPKIEFKWGSQFSGICINTLFCFYTRLYFRIIVKYFQNKYPVKCFQNVARNIVFQKFSGKLYKICKKISVIKSVRVKLQAFSPTTVYIQIVILIAKIRNGNVFICQLDVSFSMNKLSPYSQNSNQLSQ